MAEFAINSSMSSLMKYAPFKLSRGYMPSMIKTLPEGHKSSPGIKAFALQALRNMAHAHDAIIKSCVFQCHWANCRQQEEPTIEEGNLVHLSTKNLSLPKGRARKLMPQFIGPYKVGMKCPAMCKGDPKLRGALKLARGNPKFY
jgi:hypothetical protein